MSCTYHIHKQSFTQKMSILYLEIDLQWIFEFSSRVALYSETCWVGPILTFNGVMDVICYTKHYLFYTWHAKVACHALLLRDSNINCDKVGYISNINIQINVFQKGISSHIRLVQIQRMTFQWGIMPILVTWPSTPNI